MKIGIIGSGDVAKTLGGGFLQHGHEVVLGTREGGKLAEWARQNPKGRIGSFAETAQFGEVVVLAVKGTVAADALRAAGAANLAGKVVIDATNPIADAPPPVWAGDKGVASTQESARREPRPPGRRRPKRGGRASRRVTYVVRSFGASFAVPIAALSPTRRRKDIFPRVRSLDGQPRAYFSGFAPPTAAPDPHLPSADSLRRRPSIFRPISPTNRRPEHGNH
jgi:hypothetical protein